MTEVLTNINGVLAGSLHEVLVPGGSILQANFSTGNFIRFCRVVTWDLSNDHKACGEGSISIPNITNLQNYEDVVIRNMPAGGATNSDVEFGEQEVQLPEPIVAVDGTFVHQLLIMHRFEVDQEEAAFVFQ
ncbi:unnamed protein product, partial [Taenia asiatica]|uniref:ZP domain-containing protein n=1 Tax=Taenia asiatica TaxID=60517 RepID=A0A0R3WHI5_TAEAS